jgi:ubiquitin-protein ligase
MSATSIRRIRKEWSDINMEIEKYNEPIKVSMVGEELTHWSVILKGPQKTPYENGNFILDITFPSEYPFKPPVIKFCNRVYHPNINDKGAICLDILKDQWSPALSIFKVIISISSLLASPNPNDPLSPDVANVYKNDIEKYNKTARDWTNLYAK